MRPSHPENYVSMDYPCKNGHLGFKYKTGFCVECSKLRGIRRTSDSEERKKRQQRMRLYKEVYPWVKLMIGARGRAKERGWEFGLDVKWAKQHWNGKCEMTGLQFDIAPKSGSANIYSPSIDRIDSTIGYLPQNCRFVLHGVNTFKGTGSDDDLYTIASAMLHYKGIV